MGRSPSAHCVIKAPRSVSAGKPGPLTLRSYYSCRLQRQHWISWQPGGGSCHKRRNHHHGHPQDHQHNHLNRDYYHPHQLPSQHQISWEDQSQRAEGRNCHRILLRATNQWRDFFATRKSNFFQEGLRIGGRILKEDNISPQHHQSSFQSVLISLGHIQTRSYTKIHKYFTLSQCGRS